jgi:hypothetical protein
MLNTLNECLPSGRRLNPLTGHPVAPSRHAEFFWPGKLPKGS